ncbi:YbaK/EbsC family protein [Oceanimonas baumannii]|uniref:aminoacyl-tRNA deacylase n=1 Tax=Oceanimonas baumannii TaxID=129578 RepID=UPI001D181DA6|nr:YbaK/EbsC family protein [Oceanimonas baumannii]MCC4263929.1 YbaK/EbsC family protein [Oceanimonas baumannii]
MGMSLKLKKFLDNSHVAYNMVHHPYAEGAAQSAIAGHVPLAQMAKAIMLENVEGRSVMAVIPAADRIDMRRLSYLMHDELQLAPEHHLGIWFDDCDPGAIPALGDAYSVDTLVDDDLLEMADIYLESGDNRDLVHISGKDFRRLASHWMHGHFSQKPDPWSRVERM